MVQHEIIKGPPSVLLCLDEKITILQALLCMKYEGLPETENFVTGMPSAENSYGCLLKAGGLLQRMGRSKTALSICSTSQVYCSDSKALLIQKEEYNFTPAHCSRANCMAVPPHGSHNPKN